MLRFLKKEVQLQGDESELFLFKKSPINPKSRPLEINQKGEKISFRQQVFTVTNVIIFKNEKSELHMDIEKQEGPFFRKKYIFKNDLGATKSALLTGNAFAVYYHLYEVPVLTPLGACLALGAMATTVASINYLKNKYS